MTEISKPHIGGHVSAAGGVSNAIENGTQIGAECIQIFGSSPRQWFVRIPPQEEIERFKERHSKSSINEVFLHAPYLVNLASPLIASRKRSIGVMIGHMKIAEAIGATGLIFHVGSGGELPKEQALKETIRSMKEILKGAAGKTFLIIENSAGGGKKLASLPEDIGSIMEGIKSPRVKVCYDTAHAFEAGIIKEYSSRAIKKHFDLWDKTVGLSQIVAIHTNDSKTKFDSHHDRHENIGQGYIGLNGFKALAGEKRLWNKPWLLEVPGFKNEGPDKKNVDILRSCFS